MVAPIPEAVVAAALLGRPGRAVLRQRGVVPAIATARPRWGRVDRVDRLFGAALCERTHSANSRVEVGLKR